MVGMSSRKSAKVLGWDAKFCLHVHVLYTWRRPIKVEMCHAGYNTACY